jgi:hypothetical protein
MRRPDKNGHRPRGAATASAAFLAMAFAAITPQPSAADQGGVGFWLPGSFGSLAAAPLVPGWTLGLIYLHSAVSAGGDVAASRAIDFPNRRANLRVNLSADLNARVDLGVVSPSYTFATPVLGGQFSVAVLAIYGRQQADIDAKISGALGPIGFAGERNIGQSLSAFGDIFVQPTLRWNRGVHNYMVYGMFNVPVGAYNPTRLVDLGLGHWSIDAGAGYTYFNPATGWEFSAVAGLTYNFKNPYIEYQNGIDAHLDWGVARFLSKQVHVGLVGYAYQQITGDSGTGATLGHFKSRVFGIGPQIGYIFPVGGMQGYVNLKGYGEFGAQHRPEGWNVWLTLAISPAPPPHAAPPITTALLHK